MTYPRIPAGHGYATLLPDFDFEAYSEAGYYWDGPAARWRGVTKTDPGLPAVGASVYTEHPSTEILSLAYDLKDGRPARLWTPDQPPPYDLFDHILAGGLLEAWNSSFEFLLWLNVCHRRMGWPALDQHQLRCAMAKARAFSLPGGLDEAAKAISAGEQKDAKGKALIRKLCVPRQPSKKQIDTTPAWMLPKANRLTPLNAPEDYADLYAYCRQDIKAEAAISALCPDLSPDELNLWLLDQRINFRGVAVDRSALDACISIVRQAETKYTEELKHITSGTVQSASELEKILGWLAGACGVRMGNLDADAVDAALKRELPPAARRVLTIRSMLGASSVKKLFAIERRISADGRLRDLFAYCGADRTGRWAGRGPQPQNLPGSGPPVKRCGHCGRACWSGLTSCPACWTDAATAPTCDWGIEAAEAALADIATRSLEHVERMWGDAIAAVSGCLRSLFCADHGKELICSDFSAIEAVVLAEIAGEEWRQEVFRTHGKIYEMSASKISGVPFDEFLAYKKKKGVHHPLRKKVGKVAELASGYGGGLGAWKAFGADAFMADDEIQRNVYAWREASPAIAGNRRAGITGLWYGLQEAAHLAVSNPGTCYAYQARATKFGQPPPITYGMRGDVLYCRLPSGRCLCYHKPRLEQTMGYGGRVELALTYWGYNSDYKKGPKGWMKLDTWGGKLTENIIQAISRDILGYSMPNLEAAGYPVVLHVHDEIVSEVTAGTGDIAEFERIMSTLPAWAAGWPVKAAGGWRGGHYRKD